MSVQVPISQKMPLLKESPWKGLDRGPACMELQGILGSPRINPARRGGGKEAPGDERVCNRAAQGRPQETS